MENETSDRIEGNAAEVNENTIVLRPVPLNASGEGLPYAPQDWPLPGDNWRWKVGRRITPKGFHVDRYLYLPTRFQVTTMKKKSFKSKLSVQQYVEKEFPGVDIDGFFASFSWKIPYKLQPGARGNDSIFSAPIPIEVTTVVGSDSQSGTGGCKAGNNICISLLEEGDQLLTAIDCDICCSEPGFCRECCCILCCKIVSLAYGGYSFVKCESKIDKNFICGHVAHIECALRSYMAGTVGGSIGLDAEYYCRLCDARTELISHVTRLLQTCKTLESQDEIEKILNLGVCILRGSQKQIAKGLLNRIESAIAKLKSGTCIGEVWKEDEYTHDAPSGMEEYNAALEARKDGRRSRAMKRARTGEERPVQVDAAGAGFVAAPAPACGGGTVDGPLTSLTGGEDAAPTGPQEASLGVPSTGVMSIPIPPSKLARTTDDPTASGPKGKGRASSSEWAPSRLTETLFGSREEFDSNTLPSLSPPQVASEFLQLPPDQQVDATLQRLLQGTAFCQTLSDAYRISRSKVARLTSSYKKLEEKYTSAQAVFDSAMAGLRKEKTRLEEQLAVAGPRAVREWKSSEEGNEFATSCVEKFKGSVEFRVLLDEAVGRFKSYAEFRGLLDEAVEKFRSSEELRREQDVGVAEYKASPEFRRFLIDKSLMFYEAGFDLAIEKVGELAPGIDTSSLDPLELFEEVRDRLVQPASSPGSPKVNDVPDGSGDA